MADKYVMRYLPEHHITFIHNPKTAGTSISTWLDDNFLTVRGRKHGHHIEVSEFFPDTVFTFGVVRNPWERLASWYKFSNKSNETFRQWIETRLFHQHSFGLTFRPQLAWSQQWYTLDTPQADWFGDDVNMILRFENLHEDFDKIKNILHCSKDLAIINANTTYDYRTLYDDDLVEIVRDIYIKDVIKYGYEYEI
jgi:hypothetical protein